MAVAPPLPPTRMRRSEQPSAKQRRLLPGYLAVVIGLAVVAIGTSVVRGSLPHPLDWARTALLIALCMFATWEPRHSRPHTKTTLEDVPLLAAVLLLPAPLALVVPLVGKLPGQVLTRRRILREGRQQPWFVMMLNLALAVLQVYAGHFVFVALGGTAPLPLARLPMLIGALLITPMAMYLTNLFVLAGVTGLQRSVNPFTGWWNANRHALVDRSTLYALGLLGGVLGAAQWWASLCVIPAMVGVMLSFDHAARAYLWEEAATRDVLTSLYNRLYFFERLGTEYRHVRDKGEACGLILVDLDDMKSINDTHGHLVGDSALIRAADFLRSMTRSDDVVARIGGDEYAILLPHTTQTEAEGIAARIRSTLPLAWSDGPYPPLMFSLGIAVLPNPEAPLTQDRDADLQRFIHVADEALYREKALHHPLGTGRSR